MESKRQKQIPEKKQKILEEIISMIKEYNTIMIALIENLSSAQFQKLKKLLSDKIKIRVIKKTLVLRALEESKKDKSKIEVLEKSLASNFALVFSNLDPFEIAAIFSGNKTRVPAKPGYIAKEDIVVEAGPTDLPAGPAISQLSKINLKASIEGGKIVIKERSIVVKAGEPVGGDVANVLAQLEVNPVVISLQPVAAYDTKAGKVYENIKVDKDETLEQLKIISRESFNFALNIEYAAKETIKFLLMKAASHFNSLKNKIPEKQEEKKETEQKETEEKQEDKDNAPKKSESANKTEENKNKEINSKPEENKQ